MINTSILLTLSTNTNVLTDSKSQTEILFSKDSKIDAKNILNRSNLKIPDHIIDKIAQKGISVEDIDAIGVPVFKYLTQITIHGIFDEKVLQRNIYGKGYKNLVVNKNGSLGVRYNGIDEEKKNIIKKSLFLCQRSGIESFSFHHDSKGTELYKNYPVTSKEQLMEIKLLLQEELNTITEPIGNTSVYSINHPFYGLFVCSRIFIYGIYQQNIWDFISKLTKGFISSELDFNTKSEEYKYTEDQKYLQFQKELFEKKQLALKDFLPRKESMILSSPFAKTSHFTLLDKVAYAFIRCNYDNQPEIQTFFINKLRGRYYIFCTKTDNWDAISSNYEPSYRDKRTLLNDRDKSILSKKANENELFLIDLNGQIQR